MSASRRFTENEIEILEFEIANLRCEIEAREERIKELKGFMK